MDACIFCKIARGEIPAAKVFEDDHTLAFLDLEPLARGHSLVIPKAHVQLVEDLSPADAAALWSATCEVSARIRRGLGVPATTIAVNNGPAAGQEVPHAHVHVVPRAPGDEGGPIHAIMTKRPSVARDELTAIAATIRDA